MGEIVFITGTDTGVGKTILTALLLQHLRSKNINALAMKPFCTGDRGDVELLQSLQPGILTDTEANPYFFDTPVAPYVAAQQVGQKIQVSEVIEKISLVRNKCDVLLVEGAGGVMVPISEKSFILDLIVELRAKTIVVSANKLGTLNHTLLTVAALQDAGCEELTVSMMQQKSEDISARSNLESLRKFLKPVPVFAIPYLGKTIDSPLEIAEHEKKIKKTLAALIPCG